MHAVEPWIKNLQKTAATYGLDLIFRDQQMIFSAGNKSVVYKLSMNIPVPESDFPCFTYDMVISHPAKILGLVRSKLKLNKTIFARNCEVETVDSFMKNDFLSKYHLMGATNSAYNLGLFHLKELVAIATFSKGRKMNRLPDELRSFELIRFCSKHGLTVTGGLSKLVKHFCKQKNAGDIMTYVNKQYSDEKSFLRAGFVLAEPYSELFADNKNSSYKKDYSRNSYYNSEKNNILQPHYNLKLLYLHKSVERT